MQYYSNAAHTHTSQNLSCSKSQKLVLSVIIVGVDLFTWISCALSSFSCSTHSKVCFSCRFLLISFRLSSFHSPAAAISDTLTSPPLNVSPSWFTWRLFNIWSAKMACLLGSCDAVTAETLPGSILSCEGTLIRTASFLTASKIYIIEEGF